MFKLRKSEDRGIADHGWLLAKHTFSFADYYDTEHMGFRSLRVINEDRVQPGQGFGTHPHADMEILTYIISGQLSHKDSMGNGRTIKAGEVQAMSAGTGVTHSEFNASSTELVHLLQIWIVPERRKLKPSYAEWLPTTGSSEPLTLVASRDGAAGSVVINQDAKVFLGRFEKGFSTEYAGRHLWLQMISGELDCSGNVIYAGDGLAVSDESKIILNAKTEAKFLMFDLA